MSQATHCIVDKQKLGFYIDEQRQQLASNGVIEGLAAPTQPDQAASKRYVDDRISGADPHEAVDYVSYVSSFPGSGNALSFSDHGVGSVTIGTSVVRVLFVNIGGSKITQTVSAVDSTTITVAATANIKVGMIVRIAGNNSNVGTVSAVLSATQVMLSSGADLTGVEAGTDLVFALTDTSPLTNDQSEHEANGVWEVKSDGTNLIYRRPNDWGGDDDTLNTDDAQNFVSAADHGGVIYPKPNFKIYHYGTTVGGTEGYFYGTGGLFVQQDEGNTRTEYDFGDMKLYGETGIQASPNRPISDEQGDSTTWVSYDSMKVSRGAYVAVCCGMTTGVQNQGGNLGRGAAYILSTDKADTSSGQKLFVFRSSNLDFSQGVDNNTIQVDADSRLALQEGNASHLSGVGGNDWSNNGFGDFTNLSDNDSNGIEPRHLHTNFVQYLNDKIDARMLGVDVNEVANENGSANGSGVVMGARAANFSTITSGTIDTTGNTTVAGTLTVSGTTSLQNDVEVSGTVTLDQQLTVGGDLGVSGATSLSGGLFVQGATSINSTLEVMGTSALDTLNAGTLEAGETSISELEVTDTSRLNIVTITGTTSVGGDLTVGDSKFTVAAASGNTAVVGASAFNGQVTLGLQYKWTVAIASNDGSTTVQLAAGDSNITPGMLVLDNENLQSGTTVAAIDGVNLTLSQAPTGNLAGNLTFMAENADDGVVMKNYEDTFNVTNGGKVVASEFASTSDVRLKSNIAIESGADCLEDLAQIDCLTYEMQGKSARGVSAQALQQVMPELVAHSGEYLAVNYAGLTAACVGAINELNAKVAAMQAWAHYHRSG